MLVSQWEDPISTLAMMPVEARRRALWTSLPA
jgi:hypothetical protein